MPLSPRIYDISLPLTPSLAVWPGDTPFDFQLSWKLRDGATVNLGWVTMSVHAGTHLDAPYHFCDTGAGAAEMDLEAFIGPAVVLDVSGHDVIEPETLAGCGLDLAPRILLRTGAWPDRTVFPASIPVMAPEIPAFLRDQGVVLVGLDVPSVDAIESTELPNHHALARYGIRILESLTLDHVPPGHYELIALPLALLGADASPTRAILRALA